jgi:hypothetical protein
LRITGARSNVELKEYLHFLKTNPSKQESLVEYRQRKETPSSKNSYDESNSATQMMTIQLSTENAMIIKDAKIY